VDQPILSVAIPSFNRPSSLADLLASIATEVAACPEGLIEVCITDDASPDPEVIETALAFVEKHRFASLRIRPSNVGLERNFLAAGEPCRGDYLLLLGNDDILVPGALTTILDDIRTTSAPVLLYAKRRINLDGSPRADVAGSTPIEIPEGATHMFDSFLAAAREQGLMSTFGFLGPIVVQRRPFLDIDPRPYLDLTMYAPLAVMVEAFAGQQVFYRNVVTILHRTPTQSHKHAESIGRREEEFMTGGKARLARYFGTSLAAALQRLVDRGALDHVTIASMPEHLMTKRPLAEWISHNRKLDPAVEERLDESVVEDANRFFTSLETIPSLRHLG
jgi:glycosyltransferase involved in cell wall biosynthesis